MGARFMIGSFSEEEELELLLLSSSPLAWRPTFRKILLCCCLVVEGYELGRNAAARCGAESMRKVARILILVYFIVFGKMQMNECTPGTCSCIR